MKKVYFYSVLIIFFLTLFQVTFAQTNTHSILGKYKNLELFGKDSLIGFDDIQYRNMALSDGFVGDEYIVYMYKMKRNFINVKYNLYQNQNQNRGAANNPNQLYGMPNGGGGNQINVAPCVNEDFEATAPGQYTSISGWAVSEGQNGTFFGGQYYNTCSVTVMPAGIFSAIPTEFWIRATPIADANFPGGVPASPLGGNNVAQLNNNVANSGQITKISQTFPVTASNALFQYAYAACFNGTGHLCCDQPFLNIRVKNCAGQVLACPVVSVIASGPSCNLGTPGFSVNAYGYLYRNWTQQAINLTPYIGTCITIEVAVGDCSGWAHFGYCYFDSQCSPMNMVVNGQVFPAGVNATTVAACGGAASATITAPPGLGPYNWNGPAGSGIVNNPNQTIVGNVTGNYTLTMNPVGACFPFTQTVTLNFASSPTAGIVSSSLCNVFSFTNTGSPAPDVQTYSFFGPAPPPSFTTVATNTSIAFATPGTYTVLQVVTNTAGCTASVQAVIVVPPGPNAAFTIPTATQCLTGNSFNFNAADPTGTHSYSFSPVLGAPLVGNTPNYGPVTFTLPGTYTVTHTITQGACTSFSNAVVVINPQPVATASNGGPACLNTPVYLMSSGGGTYAWSGPSGFVSAVQNPTINNGTMAMNGPYSVVVTSTAGCTSTAVTNVTVYTLTSPTITSNAPCVGSVLSLTASGGLNYVWTGPNAFTSTLTTPVINNVTLSAAGIYTLMTGTGNCTVSTTASVTVNPLPNPTAAYNNPVCLNHPLILSSSGGVQFAWAGPGAYNAAIANPTVPVAAMANGGIYTVTVTDVNGCVNSATTSVTINTLPNVAANSPTACPNTIINLMSNGAISYAWSGPLNYTSNSQNPNIINASVAMSGPYTVVGTSAMGCTNSAIANVSVSPSPTAIINSNNPVCAGGTLTLNGTGGTTYLWSGPNSFTSSGQNNLINNVTVPASGIYSLMVTVNTCTSLSTSSITINPLPVPGIQINNPVCFGAPISFTGSGGLMYSWAGPGGYSSIYPSPVIPHAYAQNNGDYTLTVTDGFGCINTTTASVVVLPIPLISIQGSTVCLGKTASVTVSGGSTYLWNGPDGYYSVQANNTFSNFAANQAGQYTVVVTGTNQCSVLAVATVTFFTPPFPSASNSGPVCLNEKVNFTSDGGLVYQWKGPNGFMDNNQNTTLLSANSLDYNGTYTIGVIDEKGCQGYTTTTLMVRALPTATIKPLSDKICVPFCNDFIIATSASLQATSWNMNSKGTNNGLTYHNCFESEGEYVLKTNYTDMYGCSNSSSFTVNAYPVPVADFNFGPGSPKENDQLEFTDASLGEHNSAWTWYFGENDKTSMYRNPSYVFSDPGVYPVALIVTNKWSCKDTIVKTVTIGEGFSIFVPNAFSPNGDGLNDVFQPKGRAIEKYELIIYDRWGEKLFQTNDFFKGWDGVYKGQVCTEDSYIWKINAKTPEGQLKEFKGTVNIVR